MTKIIIELEIEGDEENAVHVVDRLLDAGFLQDAINDHDVDDAGELHVRSAVARPGQWDPCHSCHSTAGTTYEHDASRTRDGFDGLARCVDCGAG